ncbi:MAG: hypothetical protein MZU97_08805 [Bacillus subtilis]|nr:hypothetical protein [Bacillus subtilis]
MRDLEGKTKCVIIASSGFSEIGRQDLQDEVQDIGKAAGIQDARSQLHGPCQYVGRGSTPFSFPVAFETACPGTRSPSSLRAAPSLTVSSSTWADGVPVCRRR